MKGYVGMMEMYSSKSKHCFDCENYHEITLGMGYCSEWDTEVDVIDLCIYEKENLSNSLSNIDESEDNKK